ncbi:sensor histidine kinase [Nocardioides sp. Root190]|uniref:sensor histidine kinase n=1 Tax=Nocardioides sp. Root190 TaxID=1736488 RepID=UPI0009E86D79|nr:HAMP domain-containing sensor histidine kinase [Nocardioides sp. Root190]
MRWNRTSVRTRTTLAAVVVVALALLVGGAVLVMTVRSSLQDGAENTAENRADDLAAQVASSGVPVPVDRDDGDRDGDGDGDRDGDGDDTEPEDVVWQVVDGSGNVLGSSQALDRPLRLDDGEVVSLPGGEHDYVLSTADVGDGSVVVVAVSLEDVDEATSALATPLLVGLPLLLLVVGGTTWLVASRALRPVEQIRREVDQITGSRLERRVPEPEANDEIGRLARTMNRMLERLQDSRDRQQQFVADASHELRSPLASVRQAAEVAVAHPGAMDEGELADTVLEETIRMQALVDQLLVLTRASDGSAQAPREDVDVDDLVLIEVRRARRTDLEVDASGVAAGRVQGDVVALGQVVRNLVDNASRHATATVAVSVTETAGEVVLVVEDDGPGIAPADRERVFERFVRLDDARARDVGGSGLGLAIVREVVRAHGGTVAAEASTLGGARFVVRLRR